MKNRNRIGVALLGVMLSWIPYGFAFSGQDAWIDMKGEAAGWRTRSPTFFVSEVLDMNADGVLDRASLVVSRDGKRSGIRVCFGGGTRRAPRCAVVGESENIAEVMGLKRLSAGCHSYHENDEGVLSRGNKICSKGQPLQYFRFASASSFFIYDVKSDRFLRYWDSD